MLCEALRPVTANRPVQGAGSRHDGGGCWVTLRTQPTGDRRDFSLGRTWGKDVLQQPHELPRLYNHAPSMGLKAGPRGIEFAPSSAPIRITVSRCHVEPPSILLRTGFDYAQDKLRETSQLHA